MSILGDSDPTSPPTSPSAATPAFTTPMETLAAKSLFVIEVTRSQADWGREAGWGGRATSERGGEEGGAQAGAETGAVSPPEPDSLFASPEVGVGRAQQAFRVVLGRGLSGG